MIFASANKKDLSINKNVYMVPVKAPEDYRCFLRDWVNFPYAEKNPMHEKTG